MHGLVPIDQRMHAVDQLLSLEVPYLTQSGRTTQVVLAVRVAARASQRALPGDLDGERWRVAAQDAGPGREDPVHRLAACAGGRVSHEPHYNSDGCPVGSAGSPASAMLSLGP